MIELWMKENEIDIACIQEAHIETKQRETRKEYTWFMSGEKNARGVEHAGVGITIRSKWQNLTEDISPINSRIMHMTIRHTTPITILATYAPQAHTKDEWIETAQLELASEILFRFLSTP